MARKHLKKYRQVRRNIDSAHLRRYTIVRVVRLVAVIAAIAVGVWAAVTFGVPLVEDLINKVDPSERYRPKVQTNFSKVEIAKEEPEELIPKEIYLNEYKVKNDPFIDKERIIFTSRIENSNVFALDGVVLFDTTSEMASVLPNVEKKYDNLLSPVLSGNYAVWIDSKVGGGGRIVGYDILAQEQFLIKEFAYALPTLSIAGTKLAFMQWAGDALQRLYVYDLQTRQAVTARVYETKTGNGDVDISESDMVWGETTSDGRSILKRIAFEGNQSRFANYEFDMEVYAPKTNGRDLVFSTARNPQNGDLMLSGEGGTPIKITDGVTNYDIGDNFVAYTKDDKVSVVYTDSPTTETLTSDVAKNLLNCANGSGICYYDITDTAVSDEVVWYAYVPETQ